MSLYPHHCLPQPITRYSIISSHLPSLPQPTIRYSIPSTHPFSSLPQSTIRYSITNSHPISSLPQPTIRYSITNSHPIYSLPQPTISYSRPNPHPISSLPQLTIRYSIPNPHSIYSPPQPNIRYGLNPIKASTAPNSAPSFRAKDPKDITILVVGSTGYIGRFVVKELVRRGFNVISVARERSGIRGRSSKEDTLQELQGSTVCFSDVTDTAALEESLAEFCGARTIDVVVSCLASRSGGVKDSWKIDYEATRNSLVVGRNYGAAHFVLLSAICVQKPLLEFQRAKLKFEAELMEEAKGGDFTYSIVRPTAFFKSLGGQVELVKDGKPYVMFGDGRLCACKPISEEDLASFIADCVLGEDKICKILPIGGPGKALTPLEQGEMLFRLLGKEPNFLKVPIGVMDFAIGLLDFLVKIFPVMEDAAEFGKIGRYYAAESMLVVDPETGEYSAEKTPSYGKDTLEDFFEKVIREGMAGQELGEQTIF